MNRGVAIHELEVFFYHSFNQGYYIALNNTCSIAWGWNANMITIRAGQHILQYSGVEQNP